MLSERFLAQVWQQQLAGRDAMLAANGDTVEVLHPGRPANGSGPDFCEALIAINGQHPISGDVELHINAQDWQLHGHHRNRYYDRVILHVVMWHNGIAASTLHNGRTVPVLALCDHLKNSTEAIHYQLCRKPSGHEPCYQAFLRYGKDEVARVLEEMGEERFRQKACRFETALVGQEADQVLYEGLMIALGYTRNKEPFAKLARLVQLRVIREFAVQGDAVRIQGLMLGAAGLLPSQRHKTDKGNYSSILNEPEVEILERIWKWSGFSESMSRSEWCFSGVRPENSPVRRIIGASHVLARHCGRLVRSILQGANRLSLGETQRNLEEALMVKAEGYWASHLDFGVPAHRNPTLIGQDRARDIVVNVVLPFSLAWAHTCRETWLHAVSAGLYRDYPALQENWITRHMKAKVFGDEKARIDSACQQQGLIQLYNDFCVAHRCQPCSLGGAHAAGHSQPTRASDLLDAKGTQ